MKTESHAALRTFLQILTEVPGWPDAPRSARFRRALPVLLPCLGIVALVAWQFGYRAPRMQAELAGLQPLVALEEEIASLGLACSEQQAAELVENAAAATRLLADSPEEIAVLVNTLKKDAAERGFDAVFTSSENTVEPAANGALLEYVPVRGRLVPAPPTQDPFGALLGLLERIGTHGKRIDLSRVAIRADEHKWQAVEVNLRLARSSSHEKTP